MPDITVVEQEATIQAADDTKVVVVVEESIKVVEVGFGGPQGVKGDPGAGAVIREVPTGVIDGSNTIFTSSQDYMPGTLQVFLNGLFQAEGGDFTETDPASGTFTFVEPPWVGDSIQIVYGKE